MRNRKRHTKQRVIIDNFLDDSPTLSYIEVRTVYENADGSLFINWMRQPKPVKVFPDGSWHVRIDAKTVRSTNADEIFRRLGIKL